MMAPTKVGAKRRLLAGEGGGDLGATTKGKKGKEKKKKMKSLSKSTNEMNANVDPSSVDRESRGFYVDLKASNAVSWKSLTKKAAAAKKGDSKNLEQGGGGANRLSENGEREGAGLSTSGAAESKRVINGAGANNKIAEKLPKFETKNPLASVIQRIERLYGGSCVSESGSGDEEEEGGDDSREGGGRAAVADISNAEGKGKGKKRTFKEDEYDQDDDFIDDSEIVQYYDRQRSKTKHDGFFINKGRLETDEGGNFVDFPSRGTNNSSGQSGDDFKPKERKRIKAKKKLLKNKKDKKTLKEKVLKSKKVKSVKPAAAAVKNSSGSVELVVSGENPKEVVRTQRIVEEEEEEEGLPRQTVVPTDATENGKDDFANVTDSAEKENKGRVDLQSAAEGVVGMAGGKVGAPEQKESEQNEALSQKEIQKNESLVMQLMKRAEVDYSVFNDEEREVLEHVSSITNQTLNDEDEAAKIKLRKIKRLPTALRGSFPKIAKLWAKQSQVDRRTFLQGLMSFLDPFIEEGSLRTKLNLLSAPYRLELLKSNLSENKEKVDNA